MLIVVTHGGGKESYTNLDHRTLLKKTMEKRLKSHKICPKPFNRFHNESLADER